MSYTLLILVNFGKGMYFIEINENHFLNKQKFLVY